MRARSLIRLTVCPFFSLYIANSSIVCAHFARQSSYSNARREWKQHCLIFVIVVAWFFCRYLLLLLLVLLLVCFFLARAGEKLIRKCKLSVVCETMWCLSTIETKSITLFWSVIWSISKWKYPSKIFWMMCHNFYRTRFFSPPHSLSHFTSFQRWPTFETLKEAGRERKKNFNKIYKIQFPNFEISDFKPNRYNIFQINQMIEMLRITLINFHPLSDVWVCDNGDGQHHHWNMTQKFTLQNFEYRRIYTHRHTHTVNDCFICIVCTKPTTKHARSDFFSSSWLKINIFIYLLARQLIVSVGFFVCFFFVHLTCFSWRC